MVLKSLRACNSLRSQQSLSARLSLKWPITRESKGAKNAPKLSLGSCPFLNGPTATEDRGPFGRPPASRDSSLNNPDTGPLPWTRPQNAGVVLGASDRVMARSYGDRFTVNGPFRRAVTKDRTLQA